ncbi:TadE/TadG family type IV pilus assembly protein [Streptomyces sp. NPDC042319]|uniref:TadE/TadG family type IV pilus assembly protein n=1 Tax=Streptomyces sp. NPDC042319 TaxID=3154332 RepID=UPI0033F49849
MASSAWPPYDDRGAATTQLVIIVPTLLLLALLVVQFAVAWHAQHIAQYVAERALATARVEDGNAADGRARAQHSLTALGGRVLTARSVTVSRTATQASVRVSGQTMAVVPGLRLRVSGTASGPVERFTTPAGGQP